MQYGAFGRSLRAFIIYNNNNKIHFLSEIYCYGEILETLFTVCHYLAWFSGSEGAEKPPPRARN